jgi:hypothetical protein
MRDTKQTLPLIIGVLVLFLILAGSIAVVAYQLGQQTNAPTAAAGVTATAAIPKQPPRIVTNTPTATAVPLPTSTSTPLPTATFTPTPTPSPTPIVVINHIKELGRLETTEYAMRTVIDLSNEPGNFWERIVGSDQLMLVAEGEVVAGFDLGKVTEEDITVDGNNVNIILPAPEILYSRIDNERTQVYERRTGLFVPPDVTLEGRARQLAEESIVEWATERGIHQKAEDSGRTQIERLLRALGFTDITIIVRETDL